MAVINDEYDEDLDEEKLFEGPRGRLVDDEGEYLNDLDEEEEDSPYDYVGD